MRSRGGWWFAASVVFAWPFLAAPSCGEDGKCSGPADCADTLYCNGDEQCRPTDPNADSNGCVVIPRVCSTGAVCVEAADGCLPYCREDLDCSDNVFCNGAERCMPGAPGADERGCISAPTPPCTVGQECSESMMRCVQAGCVDADGDGHQAMSGNGTSCGDDCDDNDGGRFPGLMEVCDAFGKDEDCDASTFGYKDDDHDLFVSATCCNGTNCGNDCDDTNPAIHPGAMTCVGGGTTSGIQICQSDGMYLGGKCPGSELCHVQPNGLGICY